MKLDQITFTIKTIHRPWACLRLIESIRKYAPGAKIHLLDDGKPRLRFSARYPDTVRSLDRLIQTRFDIGISAGRNRLLDSVETPYFVLLDDDHVLTKSSNVPLMLEKLLGIEDRCDLLAFGGGSVARCFVKSSDRIMYADVAHRGNEGDIYWCDIVINGFLAKTEACRKIRWASALKTCEHWDFFLRAVYSGMQVALAKEHGIDHLHVSNKNYDPMRRRSHFRQIALTRHKLRGFKWESPPDGVVVHDVKTRMLDERKDAT
ncbi:glycosyltransferase family 2 protein [Novipirellula artificiosorum]|uniref:Glycosyl transferase family 2 n=1 Tax=Novipirellula artificiosorum TaxID=2528016 RepID=A0A5C6DWX1_9BACT|nr:glycosyltransferase family 2 protein [Novipirellula artificiosorum]TWU39309.1 hypothetical protein Poly41_21330 [Novipirellula artificiosorum]